MGRAPLVALSLVLSACEQPASTTEASSTLYVPRSANVAARTPVPTNAILKPALRTGSEAALSVRRADFVVGESFRDSALRSLSAKQLDDVDRIFLGRIDIHAFVAENSSATVWLVGDTVKGAEVQLRDGRRVRVAFYDGPNAEPGWYDQDGLALRSEILGRAMNLSRVTSSFGQRLHPITGKSKNHRGVDYGAPEGTPVFTVGDGIITTIATSATAGNHIKVQHSNGFESWYLHLHHFEPGLRKGDSVKQGDIIGAVGTTGASTGPHLHYELHRSGYALDPHSRIALPTVALGPLSQPQHRKNLEALP